MNQNVMDEMSSPEMTAKAHLNNQAGGREREMTNQYGESKMASPVMTVRHEDEEMTSLEMNENEQTDSEQMKPKHIYRKNSGH